jgi:hypothetical protein
MWSHQGLAGMEWMGPSRIVVFGAAGSGRTCSTVFGAEGHSVIALVVYLTGGAASLDCVGAMGDGPALQVGDAVCEMVIRSRAIRD